jgi:hypothetical protein
MLKSFASLLAALIVGALVTPVHADNKTYTFPDKDPIFSIDFPDSWIQKDKDETGYLDMATPDDAIWIDVWVLPKGDPDDVNTISDIDKDMASWLTDIQISRNAAGDFTAGGMKFTSYSGTGKDKDGDEQEIEADICSPNGADQVAICYYGDKGADTKYKDDLATIFQSIKKM